MKRSLRKVALSAVAVTSLLTQSGCLVAVGNRSVASLPADGRQVVAEGNAPIGFLYPGSGLLVVVDLTAHDTIYSMEQTAPANGQADANVTPMLVKIEGDRLVADPGNGPPTTLLDGLVTGHRFQIVYRPLVPTAALPTAAATSVPTTLPK